MLPLLGACTTIAPPELPPGQTPPWGLPQWKGAPGVREGEDSQGVIAPRAATVAIHYPMLAQPTCTTEENTRKTSDGKDLPTTKTITCAGHEVIVLQGPRRLARLWLKGAASATGFDVMAQANSTPLNILRDLKTAGMVCADVLLAPGRTAIAWQQVSKPDQPLTTADGFYDLRILLLPDGAPALAGTACPGAPD